MVNLNYAYYLEIDRSYGDLAAEEINRRIAEKLKSDQIRFWATDPGLIAKEFMYTSSIAFMPHIKGGWMAVKEGKEKVFWCDTLSRAMCAAFLEWIYVGR